MIKITGKKRDLLFLAVLILMIKVAMDRQKNEGDQPILYAPAEQMRSLPITKADQIQFDENELVQLEQDADQVVQNEKEAAQNTLTELVAHEPDQDTLKYIETAHAHIEHIISLIKPTAKESAQLLSMRQRLVQLKKEYKSTSPAIALLGPIGTMGVVFKENELEKNLLRLVNSIRAILQSFVTDTQDLTPYTSIAQGLAHNEQMLASFNQTQEKSV